MLIREVGRFLEKAAHPHPVRALKIFPHHLVQLLAIRILFANSIQILCQRPLIYYLQLLAMAAAMNKFGSCIHFRKI